MDATLLVKEQCLDSQTLEFRKEIKVVIVEKFLLTQATLRKALEELPSVQSIAALHHLSEVRKTVQNLQPDLIIMGMSVSLKEALQITKMIRTGSYHPAIIIITGSITPEIPRLLVKSGVHGILDASSTEQDVQHAVEACATGNIFYSRAIYDHLAMPDGNAGSSLTTREMQVLALILEGDDNNSISKRLYITIKTVEAHITRIYSKLHVSSRSQAILRTQELCLF